MTLDEIKSLVPLEDFILDSLWEEFQATGGPADADAFATWLVQEGHVAGPVFGAPQAHHDVDIVDLAELTLLPGDLVHLEDGEGGPGLQQPLRQGHEVLGSVGKGSMAEVWVALEQDLRRRVALKRLHPRMAAQPSIMARFFREAQITAQLEHPNIVPVYRLEASGSGELTYSMKLIQGKTLRAYLKETRAFYEKKQPVDEEHLLPTRLRHFLKVCDAVAYAHGKGVIHRDLKPTNIMIGPYHEVYLMDWGVARLAREATEHNGDLLKIAELDAEMAPDETRMGVLVGTPGYLSPEQASGDPQLVGPPSDQYALGLILFELVTLRRANPGTDAASLVAHARAGHTHPIEHFQPSVPIPRELRAIIQKATAVQPARRYPSVEALSDDLLRYLDGEAVLARPDSPWQGLARWLARHRDGSLRLMAALLVAILVTIIFFLYQGQQERELARAREQALGQMLTAVASQSHKVDAHFLMYEGLLQGLAGAASQALRTAQPAETPFYLDTDFQVEERAPPDLAFSPHYRMPISVDWPVFKLAPGVAAESVHPILLQLAPLRHHFRPMMVRSQGNEDGLQDPLATRSLITEEGVPLVWTYVAVQEGIHQAYPGKAGYPPDYDPRKRPWYQLAAGKVGPQWGNPYPDTLGQGLLLPCAMSLYDGDGSFLGVAGLELTFDYVIDHLLDLPGQQAVTETALLDERGRIVIRSGQRSDGQVTNKRSGALDLPLYPQASVVAAVTAGASGYGPGREEGALVFYYRMDALGWTYVVDAQAEGITTPALAVSDR